MIEIGQHQTLVVRERREDGLVLGVGNASVFLPAAEAPADAAPGTRLRVFVLSDDAGRLVATTRAPRAAVGEFACLTVVDVTPHGAFLDWGLAKDLFVPFREQHHRMRTGERHVVAVCLDERSQRVVGTSRLGRHLDYAPVDVEPGQAVSLLVYGLNELGAQVIVDGRYPGMVYASETFQPLAVGDAPTGWVRRVRPDGKLDVALQRVGRAASEDAQGVVLTRLREAGGRLALHDKSPPDEIARVLGMSKGAFKKAVGGLYKARRIVLEDDGIVLAGTTEGET